MKTAPKTSLLHVTVLLAIALFVLFPLVSGIPLCRWEKRDNPLRSPIAVRSANLDGIVLADGRRCLLAGISWPEDAKSRAESLRFLRMATRQGVEVVRPVGSGDAYIFRCEPRIFHWCGNDSISAHYEQQILNELLVASGYAVRDESALGLTEDERYRIEACERIALESTERGFDFDEESGINISDALRLDRMIEYYASEIKLEKSRKQPSESLQQPR